jgi:hypothetical protein
VAATVALLRLGVSEGGVISISGAGQTGGELCVTRAEAASLNSALQAAAAGQGARWRRTRRRSSPCSTATPAREPAGAGHAGAHPLARPLRRPGSPLAPDAQALIPLLDRYAGP